MYISEVYLVWLVFLGEGFWGFCSQEGRLTSYLLNTNRYSSQFRPVRSDNHPVNVKHSLILHRIVKLEEKHLKIALDVRIKMQWQDVNLMWNTSEYGNITQINLEAVDIWTPQIILYNSADTDSPNTSSFRATVTHEGNVTWVIPMITKSSCQINVDNFPLDEQKCRLTFGSWNYDITKLTISPANQYVSTEEYLPNGEWTLISASSESSPMSHFCCKSLVSSVSYVFHVRRRPLFYVTIFILPCALISVMTLLVFLMPEVTGERMAVGVTILLSLAVFFLMVEEKMPVAENLPLIGKYYCCTIIEVSMSLVAMCHVLRFVHNRPRALPDWVQKYILGYLARIVFYERGSIMADEENTVNTITQFDHRDSSEIEEHGTKARMTVNKWKKPVLKEKRLPVAESRAVKILAENVKEQDKTDELQEQWNMAANVLNRFFIWLYLACIVITLIAVFAVDTTRFET